MIETTNTMSQVEHPVHSAVAAPAGKGQRTGLRNTASGYGLMAILLHWLVALVVFGLFTLGVWMTGLTYYDEWYKTGPYIHKSIGLSLIHI